MSEDQESKGVPPMFTDPWTRAWMEEHVTELRQSVSGNHFLYWSLAIGFVVGLAAQVAGYFLLSSLPTGILGLLADLLHALGWSLWTGVVVAVFVEVIPEVKRRQIRQTLEAYEAFRHAKAQGEADREGTDLEGSRVRQAELRSAPRAEPRAAPNQPRNRPRKGG